jgi:hypothetical protein
MSILTQGYAGLRISERAVRSIFTTDPVRGYYVHTVLAAYRLGEA